MPLYADIRINEQLIKTINIGRIEGGTRPNDLNTYMVIETNPGEKLDWWEDDDSVTFVHRYGDGAEVCVALALKALGYAESKKTGTNPPKKRDTTWDGNGWDYRKSKSSAH